MTQILDGKKLRDTMSEALTAKISTLTNKPKLVIIQIGHLEESDVYIKVKKDFASKIGATVVHNQYPESVSENEVIADIQEFNKDNSVHGIMVQLPIPANLDTMNIVDAIDPKKDVDGLTSENTKRIFDNNESFVPATTLGILTLLEHYHIDLVGKKVVIIGQSALVGRPTALAFLNRKSTVTVCHTNTRDIAEEARSADILIAAAGVPHMVTRDFVRPGQIIVDVGTSINSEKKVVGDVDFENVKDIVASITPVPGGVGPMTVYSLFENLIKAYN